MPLDEDNVKEMLEEFVTSEYGESMFGCHEKPESVGITGEIGFVDLDGPEVTLSLEGQFWHRRETVLGRAAQWLNACMPEITAVNVGDMDELKDDVEELDPDTGALMESYSRKSPDFNGDRSTMERMGIDPDTRGPFPPGVGGFATGGSMSTPA